MKMIMKRQRTGIFLCLAAFFGVMLSLQGAQAAFVNETFGFIPIGNTTFAGANLQTATSVTFSSMQVVNVFDPTYNGNPQSVALALMDPVTLNPLILPISSIYIGSNGDSQPYQNVTYNNFLSFGPSGNTTQFVFDMTGIRFSSPTGGTNFLDIQGIGNLRDTQAGGYDMTSAAISFGFTGMGGQYANESASFATVVPIPGAIWLLGSGLVGLVGLRKKFSR